MHVNPAANTLLAPLLFEQLLFLLDDRYTGLTKEEKHLGMNYRLTHRGNATRLQAWKDRLLVIRRERGTKIFLDNLEADWEPEEREEMRRELLTALDFDAVLHKLRRKDDDRHTTLNGHYHEQGGYYDTEAA